MNVAIGRLMQLVAMVLLPVGLSYGLVSGNVRHEVGILALGGFLFILGRIVARETKS
ncbi:MAG TPA: hypothetical protein VEK57_05985 [Thermoanaerobaculia bacterium]|nr:hypothetical protein [Thermoanaerobaculia bacterium]